MTHHIVVVGAGQMGSGIAQVCAAAGYQVRLVDVSLEQLKKGEASIIKNLDRQIGKNHLQESDKQALLANLSFWENLESSPQPENVDLLIEAVNEDRALKSKILAHYDRLIKPIGILASNTSSLSLTQLATSTRRPDKVIGVHFMNPVPIMQLVEVIRGLATSDETLVTIQEVVAKLNKTLVLSHDYPGFIVNRILMPMINEAVYALYEGVSCAEDIDTAMKLGTNQPMGPLALADLIGLDTCLSIMSVLHSGLGDSKYRPCPLLVNYVHAGWLGRKSGRGFFSYS